MDGISKAARVGQMIIGVVYLVAGAIKTWEPVLFYWEAIPYAQILGVTEWETASAVAKVAIVLGRLNFSSAGRCCSTGSRDCACRWRRR